jgi:hypothetical protein
MGVAEDGLPACRDEAHFERRTEVHAGAAERRHVGDDEIRVFEKFDVRVIDRTCTLRLQLLVERRAQ